MQLGAGPTAGVGRVETWRGGVRLSMSVPALSSGGALVARPWLRFHPPLIEPDVRIGRVAQPLLAFAPTDPTASSRTF
jgi:hypothetical protein